MCEVKTKVVCGDERIAVELLAMRTAFGTVFDMQNGQYQAVQYGEPINEWNEDTSAWQPIDRRKETLEALLTYKGEDGLRRRIQIDGKIVAIEKNVNETQFMTLREHQEAIDARLHPEYIVNEIQPDVDLRIIRGRRTTLIAEYKSAEALQRPIRLMAKVLPEDGLSEAEEEILFDADSKRNANAELTASTSGVYMVSIATVGFIDTSTACSDTYVVQGSSTSHNTESALYIGIYSQSKLRKSLLKFTQLPALDSSRFVTKATLKLKPMSNPGISDYYIYCRGINGTWTDSGVTYANLPAVTDYYQDYSVAPTASLPWVELDVTDLAKKWYLGTNEGVMVEAGSSPNGYVKFSSSEGAYPPVLTVEYASLAGLEGYFTYDGQSVGRAGTGYVNLANGNLVFAHSDTQMNGLRMPISITHYYNSCYATDNTFGLGYGWRTNLHMSMQPYTGSNNEIEFVFTDGDGTQHWIKKDENNVYKDQSGLGLKLEFDGANNCANLIDKSDGVVRFPMMSVGNTYYPQQISDAVGNTATLTWAGSRLVSVTDGAGRVTTFSYYNNAWLTGITTPYGSGTGYTISFLYSSAGDLSSVTYEDGVTSTYTYTSEHRLVSATNPGGIYALYTYTATDAAGTLPGAVKTAVVASGYDSNWKVQSNTTYAYGAHVTTATDAYSGKRLRYHFNDNGNCTSVDDELGYAVYTEYDQSGDNEATPVNHATLRSRMQRVVTNLLVDGSQELASSAWVTATEAGSGSFARRESVMQWGLCSREIKLNTSTSRLVCKQTVSLEGGAGYTLSCYVKSNGPEAYLRVSYNTTELTSEAVPVESSGDFHRISMSFVLPQSSSTISVTCAMVAKNGTGKAWFDCMQLERGLTCNSYNLIENSDFARGSGALPDNWSLSEGTTGVSVVSLSTLDAPDFLTGRAVRMEGRPDRTYVLEQTIRVSGNAGDRLTLGGWFKGYTKANNTDSSILCQMAVTYVGDGTTLGAVRWNAEEGEWQFASGNVVMPANYTSLKVKIKLNRQMNWAYFTGLYLYAEQFGTEYVYDAKGNRTAVRHLFGNGGGSDYDSHDNLTSYTAPGRTLATTYSYGSTDAQQKKHLLLSSRSPLGTNTATTYNSYGAPTQVTVHTDDSSLITTSSTAYDTTGNYAASQTDARGYTVTTVTDANAGTVTSTTDPLNHTVTNTYDARRRVTRTAMSDGSHATVTTYSAKDSVATVKHYNVHTSAGDSQAVTYTFTEDALGRTTKVQAGNRTQVSNTYSEAADATHGQLTETTYGNGDKASYTYDAFGRTEEVTFTDQGGTTGGAGTVKYSYDARGQVARLEDTAIGRVTRTQYDLSGRTCKAEITDNGTRVYTVENQLDPLYGHLTEFRERIGGGAPKTTSFGYDDEDRLTSVSFGSVGSVSYTYDGLGRLTAITTTSGAAVSQGLSYTAGTGSNTTSLVSSIYSTLGSRGYYYDAAGNLTQENVLENGSNWVSIYYTYDQAGQLTQVDDRRTGVNTVWQYSYDNGGNMVRKSVSVNGGTATVTTYQHTDSGWYDLLTKVGNTTITHDAMGNLTGDGTWSYTWTRGRQLKRMQKANMTINYSYDCAGLRTSKAVTTGGSTTTTTYIRNGKYLTHMTTGGHTLHFYYGAQGKPVFVDYDGVVYGYHYSMQGDVLGLYNSAGTLVVEYKYDAWGVPLGTTGTLASTLGAVQPFRYRGYEFDEETGLYYLRSRYYRSAWGKFLNPDSVVLQSLYVYCSDDPVNQSDPSGCISEGYYWARVKGGSLKMFSSPDHVENPEYKHNYIATLPNETKICIAYFGNNISCMTTFKTNEGYVSLEYLEIGEPATEADYLFWRAGTSKSLYSARLQYVLCNTLDNKGKPYLSGVTGNIDEETRDAYTRAIIDAVESQDPDRLDDIRYHGRLDTVNEDSLPHFYNYVCCHSGINWRDFIWSPRE